MRSSRYILLAAFAWLALAPACAKKPSPADMRGTALPNPLPKPDVTLTGVDGEPYRFREATEGKLTLLFFGYTNCPDICPMHMANIAAVLRDLPFEWQDRVAVVFVSADPERDTPERIREWLHGFDPRFVGLRGTHEAVSAFANALYLPEAVTIPTAKPGEYAVGHAAQVVAFGEDGLARYVYPFGTRQSDWANDLPRLLGEKPVRVAAPRLEPPRAALAAPRPLVVLIPVPPAGGPAALYAAFAPAAGGDELVAVAVDAAGRAELHKMEEAGGRMTMAEVAAAPVKAGEALRLGPGGLHGMLFELARPLAAGDTARATFTFKAAGPVTAPALVVPYAEIERRLEEARP